MEIFRLIAKIRYKNNYFYVLINKDCNKYFIKELEDGSILYPTEEEFKELNYILDEKQTLAFLELGKNYNIIPKVILRNGSLVALTTTFLLTGYLIPTDITNHEIIQDDNISIIEKSGNTNSIEMLNGIGYDFHELYGYDNIYRIHISINPKTKVRTIECQDFDEFCLYIDTKINPTYTDLKNTLNNNNNISQKYKNMLLEGINNLERYMPNVNLTVLNFNLTRLKLEEITPEEMTQIASGESLSGMFDPKAGIAYFVNIDDDNSRKFILYHEVLGHGMSEASFEYSCKDTLSISDYESNNITINKNRIVISTSMLVLKKENNTNEIDYKNSKFSYIGQGNGEGLADEIAKYAMGNSKINGHPYIELSEQFRIMRETVGLSLEDYISNGGVELLNKKLKSNDINNSLLYIQANDIYLSLMRNENVELIDKNKTFKVNIIAFFKDYADDKIKRGGNKKKIVEKFAKILAEGGDFIYSTFNGDEIDYNKLVENIEESAENLDTRDE